MAAARAPMLIFESQREAKGRTRQLLWLFVLTVLLLVLAVNAALTLAWGLTWGFWQPGGFSLPRYFFEVNTGVTLMFVLGGWWVESSRLTHGGGVALAESVGARAARRSGDLDEQRFGNIVHEMAIAAGMRPPAAMVLARDHAINAMATGWDEGDAAVIATRGALEWLTREELQGLVAHELSHIREGDTRLNMRLVGMVFGLETLYAFGRELFLPDEHDRRLVFALIGLGLMTAGWLGWVAGHALQAAVSRQREFLADARALQWTRSRDAIGGVLRKIMGQRRAGIEAQRLGSSVQHMLLVGNEPGAVAGWFDSHPSLRERVRRIYGGDRPPIDPASGREKDAPGGFADTVPCHDAIEAPGWTLS